MMSSPRLQVQLLKQVAGLIGFDADNSEGTLVPGGTYANSTAMTIARHNKFPHVRRNGWRPEDRPVAFASQQAHYSNRRASMQVG